MEECVRKNQEANAKDDDGGDDGGHDGKGGDWTFEDLNKCVSDYSGEDGGPELLRKSVERSEKAGIKRSCTVRVKGEVWCVRDGGEWKDCPSDGSVDALVGEIERLWHGGPAVIEGGEL